MEFLRTRPKDKPFVLTHAEDQNPKQYIYQPESEPLYLNNRKPAWRSEFFYEHATFRSTDFIPASEALVRRDIKYIYWPDFDYEELFDLKKDPHEERNLVRDKAYALKLEQMRKRFAELKAQAK